MPRKPDLSEADRAAVSQSVKHARLVEASRKMARIVKHTDPDAKTKGARTRLEKNLTKWMKHHGGEAFDRPFSDDHKKVIAKIETAINDGGLFALAMPRGAGKSTILKWAMLYCILTGRRKFVVVVAATGELAQSLVEFARQQISESDTLHAHYPHVTTYARATDGKAIKAKFQLRADGKTSGILWSKTTLVLPEVMAPDGSSYTSNGAILEGHGLTGAIRGKWKDTKSGKVLRPDFVLIDDPSTRESAESDSQCAMRERIITGDVLGLAGPRKRIAAVMPCTIIRQGDLAARFLDKDQHPEWQGETCALVNKWPDAQDTLWDDYATIYKADGVKKATAFYKKNRKAMDAGGEISWPHRVRDGELSAMQTAQNLLLEAGDQFWAEYQNDPRDALEMLAPYTLTPAIIESRVDRERKAFDVPSWVTRIYASSDINPSYAFSTVVIGFGEDQTAAVLWHGIHKLAISSELNKPAYDKAIFEALSDHAKEIAGIPCKVEAYAADAGGSNFDAAIRFCMESANLTGIPAYGFTGRGFKKYTTNGKTVVKGQIREQCHGAMDRKQGRIIRWVPFNADYWKEVAQRAFLGEVGAPAGASLYYGNHTEYAMQMCGEKLVDKGELGGMIHWDFRRVPGRNDFLDATAQCYALAAYHGIGTGGTVRRVRRKKRGGLQMINV